MHNKVLDKFKNMIQTVIVSPIITTKKIITNKNSTK